MTCDIGVGSRSGPTGNGACGMVFISLLLLNISIEITAKANRDSQIYLNCQSNFGSWRITQFLAIVPGPCTSLGMVVCNLCRGVCSVPEAHGHIAGPSTTLCSVEPAIKWPKDNIAVGRASPANYDILYTEKKECMGVYFGVWPPKRSHLFMTRLREGPL